MTSDPLWYKDAVIYEVHVRAFLDSNGDGTGDFEGLTQRLDYLADLGVTAIWILPFYPSPLRDDGYDIADYMTVNPDYGTLRDVRTFIREAHRRGLRVITELVCNHTSDQHPWFQRARRSKPGTAHRDFYVWSDTPDRYRDARIIFKDFETSNWTWDPVAGAYFWHRFYSHQPDLNFDNPTVRAAIVRTMDYWLEMGVDGLRLDAIPYLYEREGTNCENLPETHAFLRDLRRHIDERFADRMLLAEANQWPEDSVAYFGKGDECHMAFHFPVMPRMFMAIRMEDRFPILDILAQTPPIPERAQWALFLRNHDELTLEMVTDEERDYMYRAYASDPQARINLGIRRRLAPLLGNNRRRIELMNGLLFSLPGTPVLYYGDEIGMGDNVFLGDRNGVRTPMQWSGDRNAGFSSANRQQLYLPIIVDPEYHFEAVNVEAQQANPNSLLWWMKRLIALRKRHPAFGRGSIEFLHPENRRILAFIRKDPTETILVVANLSRFAHYAELDLSAFEGRTPVELFGQIEFPVIGEKPYFLSLGPHSFMYFRLDAPARGASATGVAPAQLTRLAPVRELIELTGGPRAAAFADLLLTWAQPRRWFRGKARRAKSAEIRDAIPMAIDGGQALIVALEVLFTEGDPETYLIPVMSMPEGIATRFIDEVPQTAIAWLDGGGEAGEGGGDDVLVDAMRVPAFSEALLDALSKRRRLRGPHGTLLTQPTRALPALRGPSSERLPASPSRAEQSNSSVILGDRLILKLYRRLEPGINPDLEIGTFLTEHAFGHTPAVAGSIEYKGPSGDGAAAIFQAYVPNEGDLWEFTLDTLGDYFERVSTIRSLPQVDPANAAALLARAHADAPEWARETIGSYLDTAQLLGMRTGELHKVLASNFEDRAFAPEPFTPLYQRSLYQSIRSTVRETLRALSRRVGSLPERGQPDARTALALEDSIDGRLQGLLNHRMSGMLIRCHGDYHAGQVLYTGRDFVIIDFEGEPGRPLSQRRLRRSALTDVAGMIRSFHYAASGSLLRPEGLAGVRQEDAESLETWSRHWYVWAAAAFLRGYRTATEGAEFLPDSEEGWAILLDAFLLQKAFYELTYELNNRPDWVTIPLQGIVSLMGS
ncbi:MAG TPA: maltose alpha-D-glucosyltransferase [Candidatus Limnocylindrales bacterium]